MFCSVTTSGTLFSVVSAESCRASVASLPLELLEKVRSLRSPLFQKEVISLIEPHEVPCDLLSVQVPPGTTTEIFFFFFL